jgi:uncharacterized DUF497 family protein
LAFQAIIWDLESDPHGNVFHCAEHGISIEEIEEVLTNPADSDISHSSGFPVVFGETSAGRHIVVVYELIDAMTVYPITAYEVPRRQQT